MKEEGIIIDGHSFSLKEARIMALLVMGLKRGQVANSMGYEDNYIKQFYARFFLLFNVHSEMRLMNVLLKKGFDTEGRFNGMEIIEPRDRAKMQKHL